MRTAMQVARKAIKIERLDHHGIVAGVIDDVGLVEVLDQHLPQDPKQEITPGEAVKGMIINGLGFSHRPLSLSPQFFTNLPMKHIFRAGVAAEHFNRHKLGRTLDQCYDFGTETLFGLASHAAVTAEGVDTVFQSLDTTSFSLTGRYAGANSSDEVGVADNISAEDTTDETPIRIAYGYSKDHRSDLKQVVQELVVTQDGGIPLACKSWDGNAADTAVFKARSRAIVAALKSSPGPKYYIADSKLYHTKNAPFLAQMTFITRVPGAIKLEGANIATAIASNRWTTIDDNYKYSETLVKHMGVDQRWIVVYSEHARERAIKSLTGQEQKARTKLEQALFHLQAERFDCESDARKALGALGKKQRYHLLENVSCTPHNQYGHRGRPKKGAEPIGQKWQIVADIVFNEESMSQRIDQKSCFLLATNAAANDLTSEQVLARYKAQSSVETGFRFLKDPLFFVSSFFLKKPSRIDALVMIMTLSLLIYSLAQRRLRRTMAATKATIPNQINQPTPTPTLRWVFQCFEGINLLRTSAPDGLEQASIDGLTDLRSRIVRYLGGHVAQLYDIRKTIELV